MSKNIVILGAAESGVGAAILAKKLGYNVFVSDFGAIKKKYIETLTNYNIDFEENRHTENIILNADEIIKSPGIPDKAPIIKAAKQKNIPIISEIEFAGRYTDAFTICITGSNGKTTTTTLIYQIFKKAGYNVGLAGNIGKSFAWQVAENNYDYYIIELSSFQLDGIVNFKPNIAILLNITPDHLDRYEYNFQNYINSKFFITKNLSQNDFFIYNSDDEVIFNELKKRNIMASMLPFSIKKKDGHNGWVENSHLNIMYRNDSFAMLHEDLALQGQHNVYNSMVAGITGMVKQIRKSVIREILQTTEGVEHRLEKVLNIKGIQFINDSKATNVNSAWYALESMNSKTVWLVGGVDKGNDYELLKPLVEAKVKAIVVIGNTRDKIYSAFSNIAPIIDATSMKDAVNKAFDIAKDNENVLLSPCCASFDWFENYEDRGEQFKKAVRALL